MPVVVPSSAPVTPDTKDATSLDGRIRAIDDPRHGGVRIKIDYSVDLPSWSSPFRCTIYRKNSDDSVHIVRGGDPYLNYAGIGWLYDQEAPLGQSVSYYVIPTDADGTPGVQSAAATIVTSSPAGGFNDPDMWLINLEDPQGSVQARGTSTLAGSYNGRNDKQTILGSPYPAVTPDARSGLATQITVLTVGETEFAAMQALLQQSVIMRKSATWERPDGYFTVDDVSYAAQASRTGVGVYAWQLSMTEVDRPSTYGQTTMNPVYSFGAYTRQYPLFSDVPATIPFDAVQGGNEMDEYTSDGETGFTGSNGWDAINSNTTLARVTEIAFRGNYSRKITASGLGIFGALTSLYYPVILNGSTYTFKAWFYSPNGLVANLGLDWADGAGTIIASDSLLEWGQTVALTPNTWSRVELKATPPNGAAMVRPWLYLTATTGSQYAYFDAVTLENI